MREHWISLSKEQHVKTGGPISWWHTCTHRRGGIAGTCTCTCTGVHLGRGGLRPHLDDLFFIFFLQSYYEMIKGMGHSISLQPKFGHDPLRFGWNLVHM